ncbi:hypothetical protein AVEN_133149-1 [Araneus ventricosus]|uniref:Uncharacterized protein n=1 Tax=Araneus ventricosus TaxID=182803 RepID=A0A4Y2K7Q5_ARAVE|nr:hypothetical protein AVEN_133149-1 [Araneus ventricosus]
MSRLLTIHHALLNTYYPLIYKKTYKTIAKYVSPTPGSKPDPTKDPRQTPSCWYSVEACRAGCQLRCRPPHQTRFKITRSVRKWPSCCFNSGP